jgi:hypothetical protein
MPSELPGMLTAEAPRGQEGVGRLLRFSGRRTSRQENQKSYPEKVFSKVFLEMGQLDRTAVLEFLPQVKSTGQVNEESTIFCHLHESVTFLPKGILGHSSDLQGK